MNNLKPLQKRTYFFGGGPPPLPNSLLQFGQKPHVGLILVMWNGPHLGCGLELSASAWRPRQQCCLAPARSSSLKRVICSAVQTLNEARGDVRGIAAIAGESCFGDHVGFPWQPIARVTRAIFAKGQGRGGAPKEQLLWGRCGAGAPPARWRIQFANRNARKCARSTRPPRASPRRSCSFGARLPRPESRSGLRCKLMGIVAET